MGVLQETDGRNIRREEMMNKTEFMNRLKRGLDDFPREEQENALKYYVEYFQEAGEDKEDEVIQELGDPAQIVADIRKNYDGKLEPRRHQSKWLDPWVILLIILASPFILTLALLVFSLLLTIWSLILSLGIVAVCFAFVGILMVVCSVFAIPTSVPTFFFIFGAGLCMAVLGFFIGELTWYISKKLAELLGAGMNKWLKRGNVHA